MPRQFRASLYLLSVCVLGACAPGPPASPPSVAVSTAPANGMTPAADTSVTAEAAIAVVTPVPSAALPLSQAATAGSPTPTAGTAQIVTFSTAPTQTAELGEVIRVAWEATGERAELCWLNGAGPTTCQSVLLQSSTELTVDETALGMTGVGLRVWQDDKFVWAVADLEMECQGLRTWFWANPPARCPEKNAQFSPAAAQFFEHGFMIWTETPDTFYVFFTQQELPQGQTFQRFPAPFDFGPEQPLAATPPTGRFAPISGFGKLWRGELETPLDDDLRTRLGWALGPEFAFESAYQCEVRRHPRAWTCYLQAPDGRVLRLWPDSTAQVNLLWEVAAVTDR